MAIRASHLALVDLGLDRRPAESTAEHVGHIPLLVAQVVELQNDRVRLAAVDAGMLTQILPGAILIFPSRPIVIHADASHVLFTISQVPAPFVLHHAGTTPRLSFASLATPDAEFLRRLVKPTTRTRALAGDVVARKLLAESKEVVLAFVNAEFPSCLPRVAISAKHLALGDLEFDRRPGEAVCNHEGDIPPLIPQVVEVKDDGVSFTAVDARMIREIVADSDTILRGGPSLLDPNARQPTRDS